MTGRAVGEEDYSQVTTQQVTSQKRKTHLQKEMGYLENIFKKALGTRLGGRGGSVTHGISRASTYLGKTRTEGEKRHTGS